MFLIIAGISLSIGSLMLYNHLYKLLPRDQRGKTPFWFQIGGGMIFLAGILMIFSGFAP
jgi:hypothetical protein